MSTICFIISNISNCGGTERVTCLIANKLNEKGHNILILSLCGDSSSYYKLNENIKLFSIMKNQDSGKRNFFKIIRNIRNIVIENKIKNVVVVDSILSIYSVPALVFSKVNHICWEHFNFKNNLGLKYRDYGRILAAYCCDYIVTLTERDRYLWLSGLKKIDAKIIPISNPTTFENIIHEPLLSNKVIIAVGRLTAIKGFDMLITAWSKVCNQNKNWKLKIVGDGEQAKSLRELAESLGVIRSIDFVNATKEIDKFYKEASFYCLSSRFEGLPMVLLEAQAYGLPIISFDCETGPSEIVEKDYLVETNNVELLAEKMNYCMNMDNSEYGKVSRKLKSNSANYTIDKIIEKWLAIIK